MCRTAERSMSWHECLTTYVPKTEQGHQYPGLVFYQIYTEGSPIVTNIFLSVLITSNSAQTF